MYQESVTKIFKLIDVCKRCVRVFDSAAKFASNSDVLELINKISQTISGYQVELQNELRRIEEAGAQGFNGAPVTTNGDAHEPKCRRNLEFILNEYRSVLQSHLPAHARAMMSRHCREIDSFCKEWSRLSQPA